MGNGNSIRKFLEKHGNYNKLVEKTAPGNTVLTCTLEQWVAGVRHITGFANTADYATPRECTSRLSPLRPDGWEGRCLKVHKIYNTKISIEDQGSHNVYLIDIPAFHTSGKVPLKSNHYGCIPMTLNSWWQPFAPDGILLIGCRGNLAIVQVLGLRRCYVPEFYFVDLETQKCIAKFHSKDVELMWHECCISPDKSRVILRPDVTFSVMDNMKFHTLNAVQVITMRTFGGSNGHVMVFDNRHGHRYLFRARDQDIQLFDFETMSIIQSGKDLSLPAGIRQIKSSPSGDYLAVRCLYPAFARKYITNTIAIIAASTLSVLTVIDVLGYFCGPSETLNMQVFPVFSACDSTVAVMRQRTSKTKVYLHKLPIVVRSLRQLCRQTIRRHVFLDDLNSLPIPRPIVKYLKYDD